MINTKKTFLILTVFMAMVFVSVSINENNDEIQIASYSKHSIESEKLHYIDFEDNTTIDAYIETSIKLNHSLKKLNDMKYLIKQFPGVEYIESLLPPIEESYNLHGNNLLTNTCGIDNKKYSSLSADVKLSITNNTSYIINDIKTDKDNIEMFRYIVSTIDGDPPQYMLDSIKQFEQRITETITEYTPYHNDIKNLCDLLNVTGI